MYWVWLDQSWRPGDPPSELMLTDRDACTRRLAVCTHHCTPAAIEALPVPVLGDDKETGDGPGGL